MPNDALIDALWRMHAGLSLGLLAVLLLRKPWRRVAGAQAAYALWALPVWLMTAALQPRFGPTHWTLPPVLAIGPAAAPAVAGSSPGGLPGLGWLWLVGVLAVAALQIARHRRYTRRLTATAPGRWQAPTGDSPGLLGVLRPRLVLPADFRQRFDAAERRWILAHEAAHARRLDNAVRVLATVLAGLAWFNPLAWWALAALRQDQELACDAAVMRRYPHSWRRYGLAMLKLDGSCRLPPAASAWQPHHPLKERIMLLKKAAPSAGARRTARIAWALSAVLGFGAVQTLNAATPPTAGAAESAGPRADELVDITAQRSKLAEACPTMPLPTAPSEGTFKGEYLLNVKFRVGSHGRPDLIELRANNRRPPRDLSMMITRTVQKYRCNPNLAGTHLEQQFHLKFD